ncbi:MAG: glutaminyl-peptide cyclotransferase [Candidatus Eisenbacteria bacterium]
MRFTTFAFLSLLAVCALSGSCSDSSGPTTPPPQDTTTVDTPATIYTYTVVNVYPHDRNASTQGLVFDDGFLYEGTGPYAGSSVRKVELETGAVLDIHRLPSNYFGEGIAIREYTVLRGWRIVREKRIVQLTYVEHVGFIYDQATLDSLGLFYYPTEGWGLTYDGANFIMSDGTSMLRFWDPMTFEQVDSLDVFDDSLAVTQLNELEYIKGKIYANVWKTNRVAIISPATGQVEGWIELGGLLRPEDMFPPPGVLNGIAYDRAGDRLFVTGKLWPKLFEVNIVPMP